MKPKMLKFNCTIEFIKLGVDNGFKMWYLESSLSDRQSFIYAATFFVAKKLNTILVQNGYFLVLVRNGASCCKVIWRSTNTGQYPFLFYYERTANL